MSRIALIIPAYNEADNLADLLKSIKLESHSDLELVPIVVNDCSTDNSYYIAVENGADALDLPVNIGIGGCVQTGMKYAYENGFEYAVQVDGDGQHPPREIAKLYECMLKTKANVVIGSRFIVKKGFQSSASRRFGIQYLKKLIQLLTGKIITDATSGFRLYDHKALAAISNDYPDEYPEPEALIYFHKTGLSVQETAVEMENRKAGKSSISTIQSFYYLWKVSLAIIYSYIKH